MTIELLIFFVGMLILSIFLKTQEKNKKVFLKDDIVLKKKKLQNIDDNKIDELSEEYVEIDSKGGITIHDRKEVDPNKYNVDMLNYTCTCKDWLERRSKYLKYDPRRLCKHIIKTFEYKEGREGWIDDDCLIIPDNFMPFGYAIFGSYKNRKGFFLYKEIYFHEKFVIMKSNGKYIDYSMDDNHSPACGYWDQNSFRKSDGNFYGRGWSIAGCRMYLACYAMSKIFNISLKKFNILDFSKANKIEDCDVYLLDFKQAIKLSMGEENINLSLYMELFTDLNLMFEDNNGYCHLRLCIDEFAVIKKGNKKKLHFYPEKFYDFCLFLEEQLNRQNYTPMSKSPLLEIKTKKV